MTPKYAQWVLRSFGFTGVKTETQGDLAVVRAAHTLTIPRNGTSVIPKEVTAARRLVKGNEGAAWYWATRAVIRQAIELGSDD